MSESGKEFPVQVGYPSVYFGRSQSGKMVIGAQGMIYEDMMEQKKYVKENPNSGFTLQGMLDTIFGSNIGNILMYPVLGDNKCLMFYTYIDNGKLCGDWGDKRGTVDNSWSKMYDEWFKSGSTPFAIRQK